MSETLLLDLTGLPTGEAIREYLVTVGEGYPYGFYKLYRQVKKTVSYQSVRRYFWILKEIGLIEPVRYAESASGFKKHLYRVVKDQLDSPAWMRPQTELYPDAGLGTWGYEKLEKKGLTPRGGRRAPYTPTGIAPPPVKVKKKKKKPKVKKPPEKKPPVKRKKKLPKVLKVKPREEVKPPKERFVMVKTKQDYTKRLAEGWEFIKMIDGNYLMKPSD